MDEQIQTQTPTPMAPAPSGGMPKFVMPTVVAALIVFAVIGYYFYSSGNNTATPRSMESSPAPAASTTETAGEYKDGTYTVNGNYVSPGGPREVGVTLVLEGDIITDASAEVLAEDATSIRFQGEFKDGFKPMVVGKNINEVVLSKVSGSSLTPKGFNDAVEKIKVEAKS
jgi:hypothetical protein